MPVFTHAKDLVDWYDNQTRILVPEKVEEIAWEDIPNHELDESFLPVLVYFRDVEKFTDVYFEELRKTPSGRDKHIRQFMEKWRHEEDLHAELINRFLLAAGYPATENWYQRLKEKIPFSYKVSSTFNSFLANCIGTRFSAVHMTWGAINEMTTLTGYKRLWTLAKHPVLEQLLRNIAREEASHAFLYFSLAKLKLKESKHVQEMTKFIVKHFWSPVGEGAKPPSATNAVIKKLFNGKEGVDIMDKFVNTRISQLPGFEATSYITKRIAKTVLPNAA